MERSTCTVENLDTDCLGRIFATIDARTRAGALPLVCKNWHTAEVSTFQPLRLCIHRKDLDIPKLLWLLRNTKRLELVEMQIDYCRSRWPMECLRHWKGMHHLLGHLSGQDAAPKLHSLELVLDINSGADDAFHSIHPFSFLPMLGQMTQLRSLTLVEWTCALGDDLLIHHLSNLRNLQDLLLKAFRAPLSIEPGVEPSVENVAGLHCRNDGSRQELYRVIAALPRLTSLHFACVELRCDIFPQCGASSLTNLKALTLQRLWLPAVAAEMVGLTRLWFGQFEDVAPYTPSLTTFTLPSLKELTLELGFAKADLASQSAPLALSNFEQLTRLALHNVWGKDCANLQNLLPPATLHRVRHLSLRILLRPDELKDGDFTTSWPEPWSNLTSLAIACRTEKNGGFHTHFTSMRDTIVVYYPSLTGFWDFARVQTIRQLELTISFSLFTDVSHDLDSLLHVSEILKGSRRMLANVLLPLSITIRKDYSEDSAIRSVREACIRLCGSVPGLHYRVGPVKTGDKYSWRLDGDEWALVVFEMRS